MKFKTAVIFTITLSLSAAALGQKPSSSPVAPKPESTPVAAKPEAKAKLPTVQEILAKYIAAIGGREANAKIKTRYAKGTMEMKPMGITGTFESYTAVDYKSFTKMNLTGIGEILDGFDGKAAWTVNPIQGTRQKSGNELVQAKVTNDFYQSLNMDKVYPDLEVKRVEKLGDADVYVLAGKHGDLAPDTFYFDVKSGMLLRTDSVLISPEGNQSAQIFYEDIRQVDGIFLPFRVRTKMTQFEITTTMIEVKHGVAIDDAMFAAPKK